MSDGKFLSHDNSCGWMSPDTFTSECLLFIAILPATCLFGSLYGLSPYVVHRACYAWLMEVEKNGHIVDDNVSSGIRMGIGTFNLVGIWCCSIRSMCEVCEVCEVCQVCWHFFCVCYVCIYVCMYVCMYVRMYICMYVCT